MRNCFLFVFLCVALMGAAQSELLSLDFSLDGPYGYVNGKPDEDYEVLSSESYAHKFYGISASGNTITENVYNVDGSLSATKSYTLPSFTGYDFLPDQFARYEFAGTTFYVASYRIKGSPSAGDEATMNKFYGAYTLLVILNNRFEVVQKLPTAFYISFNPVVILDKGVCRVYLSVQKAKYNPTTYALEYSYQTDVYRLNLKKSRLCEAFGDVESVSGCYRLDGVRLSSPQPGINILMTRDSQGNVRAQKVLVK